MRIIDGIAYRPSGQLASMAYGNGVATTWTYDARQRLETLRTVGAGASAGKDLIRYSYAFDPASNVTAIEDLRADAPPGTPRHDTQRFGYDGLHRIVSYQLSAPGNPSADFGQIGFGWDRLGNMLLQTANFDVMDRGRSVTNLGILSYGGAAGASNRNGRGPTDPPGPHALTAANDGSGTRSYPYDANGNMTNVDGLAATWDFKDRLARIEDAVMRADYIYDYSDRRITKKVVSKVVGATGTTAPTEITHYVSRLFEVRPPGQATKYVFAGDQRVAEVTGTFDATAERIQRLVLPVGWNLVSIAVQASDASGQLGVASNAAITSAFRWNPVSRTYDPIGAGTPLPAGSVAWIHTTAPLVLSVRGTYSPPTSVQLAAGGQFVPSAGLEAASIDAALPPGVEVWAHDVLIDRWRRRLFGLPVDLADLPPFLGPGQALFISSASVSSFTIPNADTRLRFHHPDHLGSIHIISTASGGIHEERGYLPFGEPRIAQLESVSAASGSKYQFTGKERDQESGLQYLEARLLAPALARFLSVDPLSQEPRAILGRPQAGNSYSYSMNRPLNMIDPSGRSPVLSDFSFSYSNDQPSGAMNMHLGFQPNELAPGFYANFEISAGKDRFTSTTDVGLEWFGLSAGSREERNLVTGELARSFYFEMELQQFDPATGLIGPAKVSVPQMIRDISSDDATFQTLPESIRIDIPSGVDPMMDSWLSDQ